ncbi:16S rRNA m(7)G-527 methyltransferase [Methylobacillus flagellatus KT]|uniref:Ribosomal RNA small subunit methyltransferase G n=1 Tax=Methylobacillus flagellatus (strain ATCC 51484 / DSM 6875 / VKM B-1610 / KT) TaxID=265072 RepID=RSMG_METFK|nr:RecName: Full=Ribosomal RNA small subunit methyltransferase G; AltName: Full=16S rRNA 7-methylguanosine methyltransferase; Short=16S rRNA m7G methyltransferase [Methylobacillus flagellatus KT]ABE51017.1 16S rRNA m(7)G-527 methyltransferase [Methylobacillus flagellatus KT]
MQQKLETGIRQLGLDLPAEVTEKLLAYLALLAKWNKVHNLTAVRDPEDMVTLHLLDSLSVLPHVPSGSLLDVGSGAGLPGIVLAICRPDLQVTTIDAVQKKASFMRQAKAELQIDNLQVVAGRVEQFEPEAPFDTVISRAFSEIALFVKLTRHLMAEDGLWLAMKGQMPQEELGAVALKPAKIMSLIVPGLDAQRHLVFLPARQF